MTVYMSLHFPLSFFLLLFKLHVSDHISSFRLSNLPPQSVFTISFHLLLLPLHFNQISSYSIPFPIHVLTEVNPVTMFWFLLFQLSSLKYIVFIGPGWMKLVYSLHLFEPFSCLDNSDSSFSAPHMCNFCELHHLYPDLTFHSCWHLMSCLHSIAGSCLWASNVKSHSTPSPGWWMSFQVIFDALFYSSYVCCFLLTWFLPLNNFLRRQRSSALIVVAWWELFLLTLWWWHSLTWFSFYNLERNSELDESFNSSQLPA